jgi:LmbE family N-acetylglucosaminyl deacetylase
MRLLIVVAHPDDETIGLGAQLRRLCDAQLLHVTDGAPRDGEDAGAHGFATLADYAETRRRELAAALAAGEAGGLRTAMLGLPDKEACLDLAGLSRRLARWLRRDRPAAVLTHAYEGGHPDHDAAAFAMHAACRCLAAEDPPAIVEMPISHAVGGSMVTGVFLPGDREEVAVPLADADLRRKRRTIDCFRTQRETLRCFELGPERFRPAPDYDFRAPPHPGALLYETYGWGISGDDWRRRAADALGALGLD